MSNQSGIKPNYITVSALFLISAAGIHVAHASDQDVDAQTLAAHLLQHPQTWINQVEGVNQAFSVGQALDAQEQARHVLQPNIELSKSGSTVMTTNQVLASEAADPQLQAVRVLSHRLY